MFLYLRIELRSLGKIEGGDELTVSYVDFLNLTEERQKLLKTQYFFDCTCEHCKDHVKDDLKLGGLEVDGVKVCGEGFYTAQGRTKQNPLTTFSTGMADKDRGETCEAEQHVLFLTKITPNGIILQTVCKVVHVHK